MSHWDKKLFICCQCWSSHICSIHINSKLKFHFRDLNSKNEDTVNIFSLWHQYTKLNKLFFCSLIVSSIKNNNKQTNKKTPLVSIQKISIYDFHINCFLVAIFWFPTTTYFNLIYWWGNLISGFLRKPLVLLDNTGGEHRPRHQASYAWAFFLPLTNIITWLKF